ncbi:MAG TPA: rhomboid family intramembrane serine protease [Mycobacteriales bacterium]|nr:rhomboid family intramembrane serine protease [Mycobacteriales bacterium]
MVFPVHDANPVHRTPVVTYVLILLNVVIFIAEPVAHAPLLQRADVAQVCEQEAFFREWAAIPRELTTGEQLQGPQPTGEVGRDPRTGGLGCVVAPPDYDKSPFLSVLFSMFLHGGWVHLLGNMLFLLIFGNNVEDRMGRLRFLAFYLLCGYAATYVFAFVNASSTTTLVGASGAIAGVLGAYLLLFPRARVTSLLPFLFFIPVVLPAWVVLGSWFLLQYLYASGAGVTPGAGVAYLAHVAGFVVGMVLVSVFARPPRAPRRRAPAPW